MKKASNEFPINVKKGRSIVKIYEVKNRGKRNYTVTWIGPNGRERQTFADLDEAKAEAASKAEHLRNGDMEALSLTGRDRQIYVEAQNTIEPTGLPLLSVAHKFAEAFEILGSTHIVEAARYYKQHVDVDLPEVTATQAVDKLYAAMKAANRSAAYLHDINILLGDFADHFQCQLSSIQPDTLSAYLNGKQVGPVSKENRRRLLVVLFNFAKKQGWLRKHEDTAADALQTIEIKHKDPGIFTPVEMRRLLSKAKPDLIPYLTLIAFGGVRAAEVVRLSWDAIDFERGRIIVPAAVAKTGRKRKIDMQPNLVAWLEPFRTKHGKIYANTPERRIPRLAKAAKLPWKKNAMRHSFGSYRLEQTKNAGQVSLEMGNSIAMVQKHYADIGVTAEATTEYWAIEPERGDRKIVRIAR
jgi:integrase